MAINPIQQRILDRLAKLPAELNPLRVYAERYARYCSSISTDETLQIAHQPWVGPQGYAILLFAPAKKAWLSRFQKRTGCKIPDRYCEFLQSINGGSVHDLEFFGLPPSLQARTPLLDRSRSQPLDLEAANQLWKSGYATDPLQFHFGCRAWTDEENIGYFWSTEGLRAIRTSGEVVGAWADLPALLEDELPAAERIALAEMQPEWWH